MIRYGLLNITKTNWSSLDHILKTVGAGGGFAMAAFGGAERVQRLAGMLERGMGQGSPTASAKIPEPICNWIETDLKLLKLSEALARKVKFYELKSP